MDFRLAITSSKNIYPDVIAKAMPNFDILFADQLSEIKKDVITYEKLDGDSV